MRITRRTLSAENAELKARLEAAKPESRQGLQAKLKAAREENQQLTKRVAALVAKYEPPAASATA